MITLTLNTVVKLWGPSPAEPGPLSKLLDRDLIVAFSWPLSKIGSDIAKEVQSYEAARNKLVKQFGTESSEKPGTIEVSSDKAPEFLEQLKLLLEMEVTIHRDPVSISLAGSQLEVSGNELSACFAAGILTD